MSSWQRNQLKTETLRDTIETVGDSVETLERRAGGLKHRSEHITDGTMPNWHGVSGTLENYKGLLTIPSGAIIKQNRHFV